MEPLWSSVPYDRHNKASLYARAGIKDYWIVNLVDRQLEVRRQPVADPSMSHGFGYTAVTLLHGGDTVTPLCSPHTQLSVADLLP